MLLIANAVPATHYVAMALRAACGHRSVLRFGMNKDVGRAEHRLPLLLQRHNTWTPHLSFPKSERLHRTEVQWVKFSRAMRPAHLAGAEAVPQAFAGDECCNCSCATRASE